jgi:hypothetical protein
MFKYRKPVIPLSVFYPQGEGVKVEDLIMVSKDGKERKPWMRIALAKDEPPEDVNEWNADLWDTYYMEMERKWNDFKRPHEDFWESENPVWARIRKKNTPPIYERTELTDDTGAYNKRQAEYNKADKEMKEMQREAMAREFTESAGGRRRTKNAKYYIKRRGTKRRRSKRHRSKRHRA